MLCFGSQPSQLQVPEVDSSHPSTQRRRSERITESLPIVVRGIDLLGQPFEERTATLAFNLHGCRYASKHHLPKNTWLTLELARGSHFHNVRARVAWIQRPHSVREFFQIAVELETPANIWALELAPTDWAVEAMASHSHASTAASHGSLRSAGRFDADIAPTKFNTSREKPMGDISDATGASEIPVAEPAVTESPLIRDLGAELERRAKQAADEAAAQAGEQIRRTAEETERRHASTSEEFFRKWKEEFEQAQRDARELFAAQLASEQGELLSGLKSGFEEHFIRARRVMEDVEKKTEALRSETGAAAEAASRVAQARLELEAVEAARASHPASDRTKQESPIFEAASAGWRERLESETSVAQEQWNELLQSSLDSGVQRLVEQLSEKSQEIVRGTELKLSERFSEIRQPLAQMVTEARETLTEVKSSLDQELARAKASLAEIEHSAGRMNEFSAQLEAATQDSLNDMRRRLEGILDSQTDEMNRRAETIASSAAQKAAPVLDALGQKAVERTLADVEMKLAPHLERVPQLLRELSNREMQTEEALRLHRERLRQVSENSQRELSSHLVSTVAEVRNDFEAARKEAIARWNEELDASGVRASHAAAESIERSSQWFQQEAQARLQVLVEQSLATTGTSLDEKAAEVKHSFAAGLEAETAPHVVRIREQLDGFGGEFVGRSRTQIEQAAEITAAAFGQVLRGMSDQEVEHFSSASQTVVEERNRELEGSASRVLQSFEADAESSLGRFRDRMASEVESSVAGGRAALAAELSATLGGYRAERDAHQKEWIESLDRLSDEATGRYRERLDTTCDSWMMSSVRRLNEHGQNVIESLMRSADQALRDSCARFFDGLAETLRERSTAAGVAGHAPSLAAREAAEIPPSSSENESGLNQPNA
jgi:hypothetical protein